jgi:hypothetical protein
MTSITPPTHPAVTLGNPRPVRYRISFYEPTAPELTSSGRSFDYDAQTPFQRISVGDELLGLVFPGLFPDVTLVRPPLARVTRVERAIYETGNDLVDVTLVHSELLGTLVANDDPAAVAWPAQ